MKKIQKIIFYLALFSFQSLSFAISDLHLAIDSSLSIPIRKVLSTYSNKYSIVVTSDFLDFNYALKNINDVVDVVIVVDDVNNKVKSDVNYINFSSDKLCLCISKTSPLYGMFKKNENLNTILKIIKKHSALIVPPTTSKIGALTSDLIKKLNIEDYKRIINFEDIAYSVTKSGAFAILPASMVSYYSNIGLEKILEIPQNLYPEIKYYIAIVNKTNIKNAEAFLSSFLFDKQFFAGVWTQNGRI